MEGGTERPSWRDVPLVSGVEPSVHAGRGQECAGGVRARVTRGRRRRPRRRRLDPSAVVAVASADALGLAAAFLDVDAAGFGGAAHPGLAARFGTDEGAANQIGETGTRFLTVVRLGA